MANKSLKGLIQAVSTEDAQALALKIGAAIDTRAEFEAKRNPDNTTMPRTLKKARSNLATTSAAAVFTSTGTDVAFINRTISEGKRYNVYAIAKVADLVQALGGGALSNVINMSIMRSMFKFRAAGEVFTGEMARAAVSDKVKVASTMNKLLVRHTVSASTAPTQASSTMQALQTLGVVQNKGSVKAPIYELIKSAQTDQLEKVLAA